MRRSRGSGTPTPLSTTVRRSSSRTRCSETRTSRAGRPSVASAALSSRFAIACSKARTGRRARRYSDGRGEKGRRDGETTMAGRRGRRGVRGRAAGGGEGGGGGGGGGAGGGAGRGSATATVQRGGRITKRGGRA